MQTEDINNFLLNKKTTNPQQQDHQKTNKKLAVVYTLIALTELALTTIIATNQLSKTMYLSIHAVHLLTLLTLFKLNHDLRKQNNQLATKKTKEALL